MAQGRFLRLSSVGLYLSLSLTITSQQLKDRAHAIPELLRNQHVASVSFAKIEHGKTVLAEAYGEAGPGVPASNTTVYNIASMSKPISAEVILRLASAGRLSLDEPMFPYWVDPDLAADPRAKLLTARMALDHQTGFPNWRRETGGKLAFLHDPGAGFHYSGEGYQYVARFAEKKTGRPSSNWLRLWCLTQRACSGLPIPSDHGWMDISRSRTTRTVHG